MLALVCLIAPTHALLAATAPARAAQPIMQVTPPPRTSGKARPRVSVAKPKRPAAKPTPARPAARGSADARYAAKGWNPSSCKPHPTDGQAWGASPACSR